MKVAVVTPFHQPADAWLDQCLQSVLDQSHADCLHILVGDGQDLQHVAPNDRRVHVALSQNIGDYGDSPRTIGAIYAFSLGADAVAFLDADNWYAPTHIASLVGLHARTKAPVVVSLRNLVDLDGDLMGICRESNGVTFSDTNCMFFTRRAADVATSWWRIPPHLHAIDDRVIWARVLRAGYAIARTLEPTANYRTAYRFHYERTRRQVPDGAKLSDDIFALSDTIKKYRNEAKSILSGYEISPNGKHLRKRPTDRTGNGETSFPVIPGRPVPP